MKHDRDQRDPDTLREHRKSHTWQMRAKVSSAMSKRPITLATAAPKISVKRRSRKEAKPCR